MANEKRLIDANALDALEDLRYVYDPVRDGRAWYRAADVWSCIESQPTVDAVEVVHGRWERKRWWQHKNRYEMDKCSVCGHQVKPKDAHNYCPNCGAKMDGDGNV